MVPIEPWRNSTPDFGAAVFCTTKTDDFRASLTSPLRSLRWPRSKVSDVTQLHHWGHWSGPARREKNNKHKLVHISCEVKFSQSTWAFICNYLTRYLPQYKKDGAGTKSFCKGKIKLMLKDLKNCEPPWWMSNLAEWLEHWCMLVKHPGARVRIHLMGHNYFPHSAYSQTELSSTLLQPKKL